MRRDAGPAQPPLPKPSPLPLPLLLQKQKPFLFDEDDPTHGAAHVAAAAQNDRRGLGIQVNLRQASLRGSGVGSSGVTPLAKRG
eukprot:CAMPEP_0118880022 /NCGR_PEP_ID=MMETSP1163-20130328/19653_1 /TAXON_ID=124430 /ORGANISM="Phaeomonas parva, Strain CCMP2877" /LENGTH=83 /DNA_ID=CAMNT_0006816301 /DNA_START=168 /DNA_END=417 /DNA_ORIENTATION=-